MSKVAVVYWSGTGNTEMMAQSIKAAEAIAKKAEAAEKKAENTAEVKAEE